METLPSAGARSITAEPQVILALGRQLPASRGALTRSAPCLICALGNAGVLERKGPAEAGPKDTLLHCGKRVLVFRKQKNSESGDWFHKEKAPPGDGAKSQIEPKRGPGESRPTRTFVGQRVRIGAAVCPFHNTT